MRRPDIAGWSSLVARRAHNPEVVGSNPAPATKNLQLVGLAGELFCYSGTVFSAQFLTSQTKSRSVTSRPDLGGQVLQIEIFGQDVLRHIEGALRTPDMYMSVRRELGNSTRELGNFTRELGNDWGIVGASY